ncbi:hypothetical protein QBC46DRAFT_461396 [Diplogelasinospora grovesii]|uniref:Uncharacterized protein n=1 Tax=Diplogelasinospora grovesii TaxID=303347 RepID=A0AAN6S0F8_9PEZI|nr:hypothetical protein QBC46DRAFT_461396 [Diplogelasinospora grovesii]
MSVTESEEPSSASARRLIEEIRKKIGCAREELLAEMRPELRREVEELLLVSHRTIGESVRTRATNLYAKDARFLFELLQNADQNQFSQALSTGHEPRIIVECNEDGFTEANVRAICAVRESSKTGEQGYIGEKGIGFKSVFKVAWKVHIQSGDYSFSFSHRPGDSGIGMIAPRWEETTERLRGPLTRMTLYLIDDGEAEARATQRQNITQQFQQPQPVMLLFLKKLRRIEIRFYNQDTGQETSSSVMRISPSTETANRALLEKVRNENGHEEIESQQYHVTKGTAHDLAKDVNRTYSVKEYASRAYASADVVLAFPVSAASVPIIDTEDSRPDIFAVSPVRHVGFKFLIHSDFVTVASCEDIDTTSARNLGLLKGVADVFVSAVKEMCLHPRLRYQWMRYLPALTGHAWDPFWKTLVDSIKEGISQAAVLVPRSSSATLRSLRQVKRLARDFVDRSGDPLVADFDQPDDIYIAKEYEKKDLDVLNGYGLKYILMDHITKRFALDLRKADSKMKSRQTSDDWHSRAAKLLHLPFQMGPDPHWLGMMTEVRASPMLPLNDGRWVASAAGDVYLPALENGISIPPDLGMALIESDAASHPDRRRLFIDLGAKFATPGYIRQMVLAKHRQSSMSNTPISLDTSIAYLKFLYRTHGNSDSWLTYDPFDLYDADGILAKRHYSDFYIVDKNPYGPWKLLQSAHLQDAEFEKVHFVHSAYFEDIPGFPSENALGWGEWLQKYIGVRRRLRLVSRDGLSLSQECLYVAMNLPNKFIGFLQYLWAFEGDELSGNTSLAEEVCSLHVLCQGEEMCELCHTWLPLPRLKQLCARYLEEHEVFPFLELEAPLLTDEVASKWGFLDIFEVSREDDIQFYLTMLRQIQERNTEVNRELRVLELYNGLHRKCLGMTDTNERRQMQEEIRTYFEAHTGVYILPCEKGEGAAWCSPSKCLLGAPADMISAYPVDSIYANAFSDSGIDMDTLKKFLRDTLNISRCSWTNLVEDLRELKRDGCTDIERVQTQYTRLKAKATSGIDQENLRSCFNEEALILVPLRDGEAWRKTWECLWSSAAEIRGKSNLLGHYGEEHKDFLLQSLGVPKLDISMVFDELVSLDAAQTTVGVIKNLLWSFNSLLQTEAIPESVQPARLLERPILPVKDPNGRVRLHASSTEFAIIDRRPLEDQFGGRVKMLDFTLSEVRQLRPFLEWPGLETRYLSRLVRVDSVLDSGTQWPVSDRRFDIRTKAHGLLRVAVHFKSPRTQQDTESLYHLLRRSQTWETDGISSKLHLIMDGEFITAQVQHGEAHIHEDDRELKVYIPHDEETQDVSIQSTLQERLVQWIMTDPQTRVPGDVDIAAVAVVKGLLNAKIDSVSRILANTGIIDVDIPDAELEEESSTALIGAPQSRRECTTSGEETLPTSDLVCFPSPEPSPADPQTYCRLLDHVIEVARRSFFPRVEGRGAFDLSTLSHVLPGVSRDRPSPVGLNESALFGSETSQSERDKKVGAAGELFVFELLSSLFLCLPGFSRENWRSEIRRFARVHPAYADMMLPGLVGNETSDIEYVDVRRSFTSLLRVNGHLPPSEERREITKYYIEVRSTPLHCGAPFFMSEAQYSKMRRLSAEEGSMCIIFRVYNLYSNSIGLKLYVDPLELERQGKLEFLAEEYTVRPVF